MKEGERSISREFSLKNRILLGASAAAAGFAIACAQDSQEVSPTPNSAPTTPAVSAEPTAEVITLTPTIDASTPTPAVSEDGQLLEIEIPDKAKTDYPTFLEYVHNNGDILVSTPNFELNFGTVNSDPKPKPDALGLVRNAESQEEAKNIICEIWPRIEKEIAPIVIPPEVVLFETANSSGTDFIVEDPLDCK